MSCYFKADGTMIMRRGDTAKFTISSEDIPFENYSYAYFAVINLDTLEPVLPELSVATTSTRSVEFTYTVAQTETVPQPTDAYSVYGYTFKLCKSDGTEDTFIPEATTGCSEDDVVIKKIPKCLIYPKVIEGESEE